MKKLEVPMGAPLNAAVQGLYRTFGRYKAPYEHLDVCTGCCMDVALEREMRRLPLRQLSEKHFYQYNDSAKSTVQPADEIKYLAPRLLELLAQGARLHHSTELYLDRLGRCEPGSYDQDEQAALQAFATAYFAQGLEQWESAERDTFQGDSAFTILLMWDYAGVPIEPLLHHWLACESDASTLHFVDACYWEYIWNSQQISSAFSSDRTRYRQVMEQWLADPAVSARWAEKLVRFADRDIASESQPACACGGNHYPMQDRIAAVFDAMAA